MANVIRKDIVQISVETDASGLDELNKKVNKVTNAISGGVNDNLNETEEAIKNVGKAKGLEDAAENAEKLEENADRAGKELDDVANTNFNKLTGGLNSLNKKLSNLGGKVCTTAFKGLKTITKISFAGLVSGIGAAAAGLVTVSKLASDLEETKNKIEVSFGVKDEKGNVIDDTYSKKVMEWSKDSTTSMGLAQQTALDMTALFGDMGTSMGFTAKEAANMSMALTQQAADLASFKNMDIDSVTTALKGVFTGETESLKNLGVVMTSTNLEAFALSKGIEKSYEAMTQAEKVQLRYQYVMEMTKNATGDYKRTGGGFANQLRTLTENFKQLGAVIGKLPMEKFASGMKVLNDALAKIQGILEDGIQDGDIDKIMNIVDGLIDKGLTAISDNLPKILPKVVQIGSTIMEGLIKAIPKVAPVLAKSLAQLMISLAQIIVENGPELVDAVKQVISAVLTAIGDAFGEKFPLIKKFTTFLDKNSGTLVKIIGSILAISVALKTVNTVYSKVQGVMSFFNKSGLFGKLSGAAASGDNAAAGITKPVSSFANIKITTVLKGIANLTIILIAMTALAAIFAPISKAIAEITDFKAVIEVVAVMAMLGAVGVAMTKAAGSIGKIPVSTIAKGLANIAIIVAGLSALFLLIDAVSLLEFDYKKMLQIAGIMAILGAVGAACVVFAGIAGMIPIQAVAMGLVGIAIALAGITAIIVAFGAIAQIPGIDFFINEGGQLLVKIFTVLGECVGAIIGGIAENISNVLPTIGKNLSSFAENIRPMFDIFAGADMTGIAAFFAALTAFLLGMTANGILDSLTSWITGGTDFSKIGTDLTTLAEGAKGFFKIVATLPEDGFSKATQLFDCLSGIKSLPKEGGIVQAFTGDIAWGSIVTGLGQLASENVVNFFNAMTKLPEDGFSKATQLFDCLAGLSSLPKEGGVAGWFSGEISWNNIATNLPKLGDAAKSFYASIANISDFSLMSKLFTELKNASEILGKDGGLWDNIADAFNGDDNSGMIKMADTLQSFTTKSSGFFELVNSDTINNLEKFWNLLAKPKDISSDTLQAVQDNISSIVEKVKALPKQMGDAIKSAGDALKDSIVSIWVEAAKAMASPVNKIISGANWILKQFGSDKKVAEWTPYARGTNGHKGGNALVNDGRGAELVQMPNGNTFIPQGKNVFIPNAPKGMKVLPAERTAQLLGKKSPTFNYASGTGEIDIWSYIDDAKGLISAVKDKFVDYNGLSGYTLDAGKAMVSTISDQMVTWADDLFEEIGNINYDSSKGVMQWLPVVTRALRMENQYSLLNVARTLFQMRTESGGNPNAINLWDSNAKKGTPSKGLMQVIDPTFNAYARPGFDENVYDPLSNILASIRYAVSRYGSLARAYRGVGYANGGIATKASIFGEDGAEMAIPLTADKRKRGIELWQQTGRILGISAYSPEKDYATYNQNNSTEYNTYSPQFSITISGSNDDRILARKIKKFVQEGINDCFESISRQSPKVREV